MPDNISIALNKKKIRLSIWGSLAFVLAAIFLIVHPILNNKQLVLPWIFGCLGILVFGYIMHGSYKMLKDQSPGLGISPQGIMVNTTMFDAKLIKWEDIVGMRLGNQKTAKFILIDLEDPKAYLKQISGFLERKLNRENLKMYGSPVLISAGNLNCSLGELEHTLIEAFIRYKPEALQ